MKSAGLKLLLGLLLIWIIYDLVTKSNKDVAQIPSYEFTTTVNNQYLELFSGGYMIMIEGQSQANSTEMYILHSSGKADWKFIEVAGGKTNILSEKSGTWSATDTTITIIINGNTGVIEEKYSNDNGTFRFGSRYLKKVR